ncbi:cysteine--tRNA ligase [Mycoplasma sp. SG1]|uniref:cysteine--tRNA ligase n=1 Tax=Mycoplasma sp. SG1 TaxID=2810348 RepID=UPI002025844D|nr:cysteine--tRNA ligase [Mycoplasma sp. SG1]URM52875.1 cysteine--tRNA ligase [Mycoplasma sp. SG1]
MKLHNSLDNQLHDITSLKKISIYVCGPTVYSDIHIGNCRPIIVFDVLVRFLKFVLKKEVFYIHNITDIDDKIINAAKEKKVSETEISEKYTKHYFVIWDKLNLLKSSVYPKVTEEINSIVSFINFCLQNNFAYKLSSGIYFDLDNVQKIYGILSNQDQTKMFINKAKNKYFNQKKNINDFALWKFSDNEPSWDAPFGSGRPGWHTECMCLIDKYNNSDTITIHGGGIDLIFPHHENERAQFFVYKKKELAKIWVHTGMLKVKSKKGEISKMAKSDRNFITADQFLKIYNSNTLRYLFYLFNYRKDAVYIKTEVDGIFNLLKRINKSINTAIFYHFLISETQFTFSDNDLNIWLQNIKNNSLEKSFLDSVNDNLNLSNAIAVFNIFLKKYFNNLIQKKDQLKDHFIELKNQLGTIFAFSFLLGFKWNLYEYSADDLKIYKNYQNAVKEKNYILSDKLREKLIKKDII